MTTSERRRGDARHVVRRVRRLAEPRKPFYPHGLLPLLGLIGLTLFAILPFARGLVQNPAEQAAQQALAEIGATWATPHISGQWVRLDGVPPSEKAAADAVRAVREARARTPFGAYRPITRVARRNLAPVAPAAATAAVPVASAAPSASATPTMEASAFEWAFRLNEGVLKLEGEIPDALTRDKILSAADALIDPPRLSQIDDALVVIGEAAPDGYLPVALRGVNTVSRCNSGLSAYRADRFTLRCELPQAEAAALAAEAQAPLPLGRLGAVEILPLEKVASCEQRLSELLSANIRFDTASAVISASSYPLLNDIATVVADCPGTLRIEGHTDDIGNVGDNLNLSRLRADAVRSALIARGVGASRLIAEGMGESQPVASNDTPDGRAENRRIEIQVARFTDR